MLMKMAQTHVFSITFENYKNVNINTDAGEEE